MNRDEMVHALLRALVLAGEASVPARRRLWRASTAALRRELLLRGLMEYEDPPCAEEDSEDDDLPASYALLGCCNGPVYLD